VLPDLACSPTPVINALAAHTWCMDQSLRVVQPRMWTWEGMCVRIDAGVVCKQSGPCGVCSDAAQPCTLWLPPWVTTAFRA
jgi:hypothetical protein